MRKESKVKVGFSIAEVIGKDAHKLDGIRAELGRAEAEEREKITRMKAVLRKIERGPFRPLTVKGLAPTTETTSTALCEVVIGRQPFLIHMEDDKPLVTRLSEDGLLIEDYDLQELEDEFGCS